MRTVKPQCLALQTAPFQFGDNTNLHTAVGLGFRLSDPRILLHETMVWDALKQAAAPDFFYGQASPKPFAEWSLLGHATHQMQDTRMPQVEWIASVQLGSSKKVISCRQASDLGWQSEGVLRVALSVDHSNSHQGPHRQNPKGRKELNPPLQLATATGWSTDPWAALGPVDPEWTLRRQFMPSAKLSAFHSADRNGVPQGWPAGMDLRYFQHSCPDQQSRSAAWAADEPYALVGFGSNAQGYTGRLPGIVVRQFDTEDHGLGQTIERPMLLKSVVFFPDQDLGLMWWQGHLPLAHPVEVPPVLMTFAVERAGTERPVEELIAYARKRINPSDRDPIAMSDAPLMPALGHGLVWELLLTSNDHPKDHPPLRAYDSVKGRLLDFEKQIQLARQAQLEAGRRLSELKSQAVVQENETGASEPPSWRAALQCQAQAQGIEDVTLRDQDLSGLNIEDWVFKRVRFERCKFRSSKWKSCKFEDVTFTGCDFHAGSFFDVQVARSRWDHCQMSHLSVQSGTWHQVEWDACSAESVSLLDVQWKQIVMNETNGNSWTVQRAEVQRWVVSNAQTRNWKIKSSKIDELIVTDANLAELHLQGSIIDELSAVRTSLEASLIEGCRFSKCVLTDGCVLDFSALEDCTWEKGTWCGISAAALTAFHCRFTSFFAPRCMLQASQWRRCDLSGICFNDSSLHGSVFHNSSLRGAALMGADLGGCEIEGCNLLQAKMYWVKQNSNTRRRQNLESGLKVSARTNA